MTLALYQPAGESVEESGQITRIGMPGGGKLVNWELMTEQSIHNVLTLKRKQTVD